MIQGNEKNGVTLIMSVTNYGHVFAEMNGCTSSGVIISTTQSGAGIIDGNFTAQPSITQLIADIKSRMTGHLSKIEIDTIAGVLNEHHVVKTTIPFTAHIQL
ncbi:hypothetical protein G3577_06525 [Morganella morganii]|uniref:hypothetical protein n=1 Tax=Morganella morganii TaxID=582 RepID=UPI0013A71325|nr:hypothetical protein [Morganella morganii]QIC11704.1 hypothetical protein G3577_06525 [Morganella morganii]